MAFVDFSNATIECISGTGNYSAYKADYLGLYTNYFRNSDNISSGVSIANITRSLIERPNGGFMVVYSGSIKSNYSGTDLIIFDQVGTSPYYNYWKISNISYNGGDTFSFAINVDLPTSESSTT